jgi:predicted nucleic-acid-binding protein
LQLPAKQSGVRAIDTNIIVRLLTDDDPKQAAAAKRIFAGRDLFIGITVMLETEWVLRSGYGFSATQVADGLRKVGGLPGVTIEQAAEVAQALDWMAAGMDFADALHMCRAAHCSSFLTFDRKLAKRSGGRDGVAVELA